MKKHISEITILRGMAIIMVILYHSILVYPINLHDITWCRLLDDFLWYVQMPLFFLVSGFCFSYHGDYDSYSLKKIKRILIPHVIIGLLDLMVRVLPAYIPAMNGLVNQKTSLREGFLDFLLYGGEDPFLRSLFVVVMIFPLIHNIVTRYQWTKIIIYPMIILLYIFSNRITGFMALGYACAFLIYYVIGYELGRIDYAKVKAVLTKPMLHLIALLIGIICFYLLETYGYTKFFSVPIALSGALLCYGLAVLCKDKMARIVIMAGEYSLQLYLLDGYFLVVSRTVIVTLCNVTVPALIILLNFTFDFVFMLLITHYFIARWKPIAFLFGLNRQKG